MTSMAKLFYSSPELMELDAVVIDSFTEGGKTVVVLDRTPFYPEGGGQPSDLGEIDGCSLVLVTEKNGRIFHTLSQLRSFTPGDIVRCRVNGQRRRYHALQHSGQHLLSAVLEKEYSIHTVGFHLGVEYCTIDITATEFTQETSRRVEMLMEELIIKALPLKVHVCPPEDPSSFPLRKKLPEGEDSLRIVEIGGYDWVPCCGTHVPTTEQIRTVKILAAERYKGAMRLYFVSGDRALEVLAQRFSLLASCATLAGCSPEEVPARLSQQKARLETLETERFELLAERARLEIARIEDDCGILCLVFGSRKAEAAQESVKAATARGFAVFALSRPDKTVLVAYPVTGASAGLPNLNAALKPLLAIHGGKGGGGPGNFRAAFQDEVSCQSFFDAALSAMGPSSVKTCRVEL